MKLSEAPDPKAHKLACSLRRAVHSAFPKEAYEGFQQIEAVRNRYLNGNGKIDGPASGTAVKTWATRGSNRPRWGRLLYSIIYGMEPETCVEFGGLIGISGSYQALGLHHNRRGRLTTIERRPTGINLIETHFNDLPFGDRANLLPGDFFEHLPQVKEMGPIDYAFIDGEHSIDQNFRLFHELLPAMADGSVMVFDDITWSRGMKRAWTTLRRHPRVSIAVDLFNIGLLLLRDQPNGSDKPLYKVAVP